MLLQNHDPDICVLWWVYILAAHGQTVFICGWMQGKHLDSQQHLLAYMLNTICCADVQKTCWYANIDSGHVSQVVYTAVLAMRECNPAKPGQHFAI
jgi:hypothetical protein